jgi:outer membrane biosynthesis protein TonB
MAAKKKAKKAKKAPAKKAKKKVAKTTRRAPAKKAAKRKAVKSSKKAPKKVSAKKTPAKKTAVKKAPSTKKEFGEGNYKATQRFDKAQETFVLAHKSEIPALGKAAEKALEGPEGKDLLAAEAEAKGHAAG